MTDLEKKIFDFQQDEEGIWREPKYKRSNDARECVLDYELAMKVFHRSQDGEASRVNIIFGRDIDEEFLSQVNCQLSPDTGYIFYVSPKGGYSALHVTYRRKTLDNFAAAAKKFPKETY